MSKLLWLIKTLQTEIDKLTHELLADIFLSDSKIHRMVWKQYTTTWNGGAPCGFIVTPPSFYEAGQDVELSVDANIKRIFAQLPKDSLERLFGDGFIVTYFHDGTFDKDYYENLD